MRGRKPRDFSLAAHDVPILQQIARSRILPWFQVQRARVVLAIADGCGSFRTTTTTFVFSGLAAAAGHSEVRFRGHMTPATRYA